MHDLTAAAGWLHAHAVSLGGAIGNVIGNRPEPAGVVVIRTLGAVFAAWLVLKLVKKVGK